MERQGLENQDEELGASPEGTREPQQVLEQGKDGVSSGQRKANSAAGDGEARRGKGLSREVVSPSTPALP